MLLTVNDAGSDGASKVCPASARRALADDVVRSNIMSNHDSQHDGQTRVKVSTKCCCHMKMQVHLAGAGRPLEDDALESNTRVGHNGQT
jgi:hypothetical protein